MDGNIDTSFELASSPGDPSDSVIREENRRNHEGRTSLGTLKTINRQLSALTTIAASKHASEIKNNYLTQITRYTNNLTNQKSRLAELPKNPSDT